MLHLGMWWAGSESNTRHKDFQAYRIAGTRGREGGLRPCLLTFLPVRAIARAAIYRRSPAVPPQFSHTDSADFAGAHKMFNLRAASKRAMLRVNLWACGWTVAEAGARA